MALIEDKTLIPHSHPITALCWCGPLPAYSVAPSTASQRTRGMVAGSHRAMAVALASPPSPKVRGNKKGTRGMGGSGPCQPTQPQGQREQEGNQRDGWQWPLPAPSVAPSPGLQGTKGMMAGSNQAGWLQQYISLLYTSP